jgi:hypothetical protein
LGWGGAATIKAQRFGVRKDIFEHASANARLFALPELCIEQVRMLGHEPAAQTGIAEQETAKLFWKIGLFSG